MEKYPPPSQLESSIQQLIDDLQEVSVTAHVRELRAKASTYARVVAGWATYAPTAPQIQAMLECVTELHEKVAAAKRGEISHVARRPQAPTTPRAEFPPPMQGEPSRGKGDSLPIPPDGVAWNANVSAGSTRVRSQAPEILTPAPPPGATTIPPASASRSTAAATPIPDALRARKQR